MTLNQDMYQEYIPGQQIQDAFREDRIPLLQMQHLRQLDFPGMERSGRFAKEFPGGEAVPESV